MNEPQPQPSLCQPCFSKMRELEIRLIGVDGTNGLNGRVFSLEENMNKGITKLSEQFETLREDRNTRLRNLEMRVYLICGIPSIVAATVTVLKLFHLLNPST